MGSETRTLSVYSIASTAATAGIAVAVTFLGLTTTQAAWFFVLAQFNVFSLPLLLVEPAGLPLWVWYIIVFKWVGVWGTVHKVKKSGEG